MTPPLKPSSATPKTSKPTAKENSMNRKFRTIALLLSLAVLLSLTACKKSQTATTTPKTDKTESIDVVSTNIENGLEDPENHETDTADGASVNATELAHVSGKANGIDVSKWQGKINWAKVKKAGIDFAIIRIGYRGENGTIYKDANADYNLQQAVANDILVGVYFFSTAINQTEAKQEAAWTVSAIAGYPISYPVVYDCEGFSSSQSRMYTLNAKQRTDNALAFLDAVSASGYDGMFYASKSALVDSDSWETERLESRYRIWVARYLNPSYPTVKKPDYSGKYDMWQYTDKGTVSGVQGNCDLVVSYFVAKKSAPKNTSATPKKAEAPKTQEEKIYTAANDSVTAKIEVNLRDAAGTNSNVIVKLKNGEILKRTATGSNGWSKLLYNGKTVYAITSYLTTDTKKAPTTSMPSADIVAGNTFTAVNDSVTAKDRVNLRRLPTTDSEVIGTLTAGTYLERKAKSNRGWSRLLYNGQEVYAITSYLTTEKIAPVTSSSASESTESNDTNDFQTVNERVTAKQETNLRDKPTTNGSTVIYTLKNGEYVTRTGKSASGWSRLEYNGQTVYAITSFLTN